MHCIQVGDSCWYIGPEGEKTKVELLVAGDAPTIRYGFVEKGSPHTPRPHKTTYFRLTRAAPVSPYQSSALFLSGVGAGWKT